MKTAPTNRKRTCVYMQRIKCHVMLIPM